MLPENKNVSEKSSTLILDLEMATDVVTLDKSQQFQREAKEALFSKIEGFVKKIPADLENEYAKRERKRLFYQRNHNAITICGTRGTGKSTFLKNSLSELDEGITYNSKNESSLLVLPVIDPTLISSKENVLVLVISLIKQEVEVENESNITSEAYKKWRSALRDLAGGLCQVDGIGSNKPYGDEWEDKTYILETGLEKARQGLSLEQSLNRFINLSLKLLNKEAVILSFDDIDTQFERGWPVLEAVRKHLTSPQLIILISGDIDLYRTLIRRAVIDSIGDTVFKYDRPSSHYHNSLNSWSKDTIISKVDRLEEQYLLKVLKPENRIHMQSLREIKNSSNSLNVKVKDSTNGINESLNDYLKRILDRGFALRDKSSVDDYSVSILGMPVRTIWQLLKASRLLNDSTNGTVMFRDSVLDIFSSTYLQYNSIDLSTSFKPEQAIFKNLWSWLNTANLQRLPNPVYPSYDNQVYNQLSIVYTVLSESLKQDCISSLISLALKNASLSNVFSKYPDNEILIMQYLTGTNDPSISDFVHRTNAILIEKPLTLAIHIPNFQDYKLPWALTKTYGAKLNNNNKSLGALKKYIDLGGTSKLVLKNNYLKKYWQGVVTECETKPEKLKGLGIIFNNLSSISRNYNGLGNIPLLCCTNINDSNKGERTSYLSISNMLSLIVECLETNTKDELINKLKLLANREILPKPNFSAEASMSEGADGEDDESSLEDSENNDWNVFLVSLAKWVHVVKNNQLNNKFSQRTLEKGFKRFYESIDAIHDNKKQIDPYLGNLIHRQLISFLASIHFEEQKALDNHQNLDSKKVSSDDRVFVQNLNKPDMKLASKESYLTFTEDGDKLNLEGAPLLELFISCPLVGVFLCPHDVALSGRKNSKTINWLQLHKSALTKFLEDDSEFDIAKYDESLLLRKSVDTTTPIQFTGLWDVLNTVPVNSSEKFKKVGNLLSLNSTEKKQSEEQLDEKEKINTEIETSTTEDPVVEGSAGDAITSNKSTNDNKAD